jgi:hypothetical protein
MLFKAGFFFRKKSSSTNLTEVLADPNADYLLAFDPAHPNDKTTMPSLVYPLNVNRNTFYQNSEALVLPGDHIRFQDISLSYRFTFKPFKLELYGYVDNIGIIWRKNKWRLDPEVNDYWGAYPVPRSYSLGARLQF